MAYYTNDRPIRIATFTDVVRACPKPDRTPKKEKKPIAKISPKQKLKVVDNKKYYLWAIAQNIKNNKGVCRCDECGEEIKNPLGKHHGKLVCHIVSGGANEKLYHEPDNHFILGRGPLFHECDCGKQFDEGLNKQSMKIFPLSEKIKEKLNLKYYTA